MAFFHCQILQHLNGEQIGLLSETPFFYLFGFARDTQICRPILQHILLRWDPSEECFKFKGKKFILSPEDVSLVMALPTNGDPVNYTKKRQRESIVGLHYFPPNGEITQESVEQEIVDLVLDKSKNVPESDVLSLLVMFLFTTTLFPQDSGSRKI